MRMFRRRRHEEDDIIEGEIEDIEDEGDSEFFEEGYEADEAPYPVRRVAEDIPTPEEAILAEYELSADEYPEDEYEEARPRHRRVRLPRIRLPRLIVWREVRPGMLLLAAGLVAGGVFWTMHNRGQTSAQAEAWWPMILLGFALVWAIGALIARRPGAFLAASALAGIGISLLLNAQDLIEWRETLVGIVLITIGLGIITRGLLLRQGSVA